MASRRCRGGIDELILPEDNVNRLLAAVLDLCFIGERVQGFCRGRARLLHNLFNSGAAAIDGVFVRIALAYGLIDSSVSLISFIFGNHFASRRDYNRFRFDCFAYSRPFETEYGYQWSVFGRSSLFGRRGVLSLRH